MADVGTIENLHIRVDGNGPEYFFEVIWVEENLFYALVPSAHLLKSPILLKHLVHQILVR